MIKAARPALLRMGRQRDIHGFITAAVPGDSGRGLD
jgi:hypothetical protein